LYVSLKQGKRGEGSKEKKKKNVDEDVEVDQFDPNKKVCHSDMNKYDLKYMNMPQNNTSQEAYLEPFNNHLSSEPSAIIRWRRLLRMIISLTMMTSMKTWPRSHDY